MANKVLRLVLVLFLTASCSFSALADGGDDDSLYVLEILGKITNAPEHGTPCIVELISLSEVVDSVTLEKGNQKFRFTLKRNAYYALRISKKGYVTKLISVNTTFPADIIDMCGFSFTTELIPVQVSKKLNRDALDFPIAIISFDPISESFIYSKQWTDNIKKEIYNKQSQDGYVDQTF